MSSYCSGRPSFRIHHPGTEGGVSGGLVCGCVCDCRMGSATRSPLPILATLSPPSVTMLPHCAELRPRASSFSWGTHPRDVCIGMVTAQRHCHRRIPLRLRCCRCSLAALLLPTRPSRTTTRRRWRRWHADCGRVGPRLHRDRPHHPGWCRRRHRHRRHHRTVAAGAGRPNPRTASNRGLRPRRRWLGMRRVYLSQRRQCCDMLDLWHSERCPAGDGRGISPGRGGTGHVAVWHLHTAEQQQHLQLGSPSAFSCTALA